jgi:protease I
MARIAFVLGEDFEDSEFRKPYDALTSAGHTVDVLGAKADETVKGKKGKEQVKIHASAADRDPASYDALVIPVADAIKANLGGSKPQARAAR